MDHGSQKCQKLDETSPPLEDNIMKKRSFVLVSPLPGRRGHPPRTLLVKSRKCIEIPKDSRVPRICRKYSSGKLDLKQQLLGKPSR